ncbi:polysaccharide biosynthesis/export family protein [candidate division KSB1 bacterium]|nr:polysaccharide biosynthesis/export family protein [candidate division KSB1 bacterium]
MKTSRWLVGFFMLFFIMSLACSVKPRTSPSKRTQIVAKEEKRAPVKEDVQVVSLEKSEAEKDEIENLLFGNDSSGTADVVPEKPEKSAEQEVKKVTIVEEKADDDKKDSEPENEPEIIKVSLTDLGARPAVGEVPEYRMGFGDKLEIKFFYNEEYNSEVVVRPDGRITLQRLGDVLVVGMTPSELQTVIEKVYGEILVRPDVTVMVKSFGGYDCYVMGEVEKPGLYPITRGMTLLRAIAAAGGPKKTGKLNSIILVRGGQTDKAEVTRIDLSLSSVTKSNSDRMIQAYDVIYVPRTFISDLHTFFKQFWDILLPPIDTYARYKWWTRVDE